jgi:integrase
MSERRARIQAARTLCASSYDPERIGEFLGEELPTWRLRPDDARRMLHAAALLGSTLQGLPGERLSNRWCAFEDRVWPGWVAGTGRPALGARWAWGVRALVTARLAAAEYGPGVAVDREASRRRSAAGRHGTVTAGRGRAALGSADVPGLGGIGRREADAGQRRRRHRGDQRDGTAAHAQPTKGADILDMALCSMGVLDRTPLRGTTRRGRTERLSPSELVASSDIPDRFRDVTGLYLETYARRLSDNYATTRHKLGALAHFWRYLNTEHPHVGGCAQVTPAQARGFVPYAVGHAKAVQRSPEKGREDRLTAHAWLVHVRTFFADICTWAAEPGSPFADHAPPMVPLTRHDLLDSGFKQARQRRDAYVAGLVLDLEREIPKIRAYALRRWHEAEQAARDRPHDAAAPGGETHAFWDWALLELLLASGLRVEEACELTTFDVLKSQLGDGRIYYLLHVKPSKYGRARVIPIGDQLGRVIAEIIRHVRAFHDTPVVPPCDRRDIHEKRPLPRAPYLLQGLGHPSVIGVNTIRGRLRDLSAAAQAQRADGSPLLLEPHDCRRAFASEHLNNNTPVHVVAALLGHATLDTVMVYAKLYPHTLVESYRRALRGIYTDVHGRDALRTPTVEEWAAFSGNCSMRDMGTHLCALPTGEHCPRGLVCLGCGHAQPKKSAAPVFRRMLTSHNRALTRAREAGEPRWADRRPRTGDRTHQQRPTPSRGTHRRRRRCDRNRRPMTGTCGLGSRASPITLHSGRVAMAVSRGPTRTA